MLMKTLNYLCLLQNKTDKLNVALAAMLIINHVIFCIGANVIVKLVSLKNSKMDPSKIHD